MNKMLQEFARNYLKEGLARLPEDNQWMFKLMYGRNNGKRSLEDTKAMSCADIVNAMPEDQLDWAMQQVENSLKRS